MGLTYRNRDHDLSFNVDYRNDDNAERRWRRRGYVSANAADDEDDAGVYAGFHCSDGAANAVGPGGVLVYWKPFYGGTDMAAETYAKESTGTVG